MIEWRDIEFAAQLDDMPIEQAAEYVLLMDAEQTARNRLTQQRATLISMSGRISQVDADNERQDRALTDLDVRIADLEAALYTVCGKYVSLQARLDEVGMLLARTNARMR